MSEKFPTSAEISKQHEFDMREYIFDVAILRFDIFAETGSSPDPSTPTAQGHEADNSNAGGAR